VSGGLDATTVLAIALHEGSDLYALNFNYEQRHPVELDAAKIVARTMGALRHLVVDVGLRMFGGSALTSTIDDPHHEHVGELEETIPIAYVTVRNTIFMSFALAWPRLSRQAIPSSVPMQSTTLASQIAASNTLLPRLHCFLDYVASYESMANLATKAGSTNDTSPYSYAAH
jgi:7-cyano-7-deazaguanine synthase